MITHKRQQQLYSKAFHFIRDHKVQYIPVDVSSLCQSSGVDLVPLSQIVSATGLTETDIFSIWGNQDGCVTCYNGTHRIAYNDQLCFGRRRFTICEELGHIICGHTADTAFNIFSQTYEEDLYTEYDEEARIVAGFLVCHPKFFYTHEKILDPNILASVCGITPQCAQVRYDVLKKFKQDIRSNTMYNFLPLPRAVGGMRRYEQLWINSQRNTNQIEATYHSTTSECFGLPTSTILF